MVTLFCLFESGKVLLKHRSLWKCNTVNTAKHLVFLIASPICTRALSQLKRFNDFHIHKVRSCAKLRKLALLIKADVFAFCGVFLDEFNFIRLVLLLHKFNCLINRKFKSCNFRIFFDNLLHLCFNLEQILGRKRFFHIKIIIKSVVNSGADSEFCIGIKPFNSLSHNMRSSMVKCFSAVLIIKGKYFKRTICINNGS